MKFRKKPVVIEAFRLGLDNWPEWAWNKVTTNSIRIYGPYDHITHAIIETLEGQMQAIRGDYIIQGVKGEIYPCKPDIFAATYEAVETAHGEATASDAVDPQVRHTEARSTRA